MRQTIMMIIKRTEWLSVFFCILILTACTKQNNNAAASDNSTNAGISSAIEEYAKDLSDSVDTTISSTNGEGAKPFVDEDNFKEDGSYEVYIKLNGGSGKASVETESMMTVSNGNKEVLITWSSPNYDYMVVDGKTYYPVNTEGNSEFLIGVPVINEAFKVIADTVAMSKPHEIEYELTVYTDEEVYLSCTTSGESDGESDSNSKENVDISQSRTNRDDFINIKSWLSSSIGESEEIKLENARLFTIDRFENNDLLISVNGDEYYLAVFDDKADKETLGKSGAITVDKLGEVPADISNNLTIISYPINNTYVAGSGSLDFFNKIGALDNIGFSSLNTSECDIKEVREKIEDGSIIYAGKYSTPDYENLLVSNCDLIIENTMIFHKPEVLKQLKNLGFRVMVDRSILEENILGRLEWVKLYGYLTGYEDRANLVYEEQKNIINKLSDSSDNSKIKTVAFFALSPTGAVTVRRSDDNICDMIRLAGGEYIFDGKDGSLQGSGSESVQMEYFYEKAKDADIIIYNGTIEGDIASVADLCRKNPLFRNFKAVHNGQVYCTGVGFYQQVMELGSIAEDMYNAINGEELLGYLVKLN